MGYSYESDTEVTYDEFREIINNSDKLVVVDFFAEWCMPCLMMSPIIEDLAQQLNQVKFVKINVDDNEQLAIKHRVSSYPCLVVFKNGKEVDRIIGSHSYDIIENKIKKCFN